MAVLTGNNGAVSVNGVAVAAVKNFSIELKADTIETTYMGVDARTYTKGLSTFSGSADIYFDPSEFAGADATFNPTTNVVGSAAVAGKFYLDYASSGNDTVFQGNLLVTGYSVKSSMDGMVEASISFQGTGGATFSTGSNVSYP